MGSVDWPRTYASALKVTLTDEEVETVLDLARLVAHSTERRNAPLAAFLAGRFVGGQPQRPEALSEAVAVAERLLDGPGSS
jgi:hypothetical protein